MEHLANIANDIRCQLQYNYDDCIGALHWKQIIDELQLINRCILTQTTLLTILHKYTTVYTCLTRMISCIYSRKG